MSELPKIVRSQLAAPVTAGHPDADVLTAFLENALAGREREQVLAHLAACSDCREVVSLALPGIEEQPRMAAAGLRSPRYRFPMWRWATVAAVAVIAAGVGWRLRFEKTAGMQQQEAVGRSKSKPAEYARATDEAVAPEARMQSRAEEPANLESKQTVALAKTANSKKIARDDAGARAGRFNQLRDKAQIGNETDSGQDSRSLPALIAAAPKPAPARSEASGGEQNKLAVASNQPSAPAPASQDGKSGAKSDSLSANETVEVAPAQTAQAQMAEVQTRRRAGTPTGTVEETLGANGETIASAKEKDALTRKAAVAGGLAAKTESGPGSAGKAVGGLLYTRLPQWQINSANSNLQRSLDAGKNWADVDLGEPVRVYATVGADIWAAGNHGALYHSPNYGGTWNRVVVGNLKDDIVMVKFKDAQHGQVRSSRRDVWTTSDGGQTWKKE